MAAIIFLIGCGGVVGRHYVKNPIGLNLYEVPIYIGSDFNKEESISINLAISEWNYALNKNMILQYRGPYNGSDEEMREIKRENGITIIKINALQARAHMADEGAIAFANRVGGHEIYIIEDLVDNKIGSGKLQYVILHEIGHILGLTHKNNTLMNKTFNMNYFSCIDLETMQRIAELNSFDIKHLNYCL